MTFERLTARASITLPIGERDWVIQSPDAGMGAHISAVWGRSAQIRAREDRDATPEDLADLVLDDDDRPAYARILGDDVYAAMTAPGSGCSAHDIEVAARTTMAWVAAGLEAAEAFFNAGGVPAEPRPAVAPRRAVAKKRAPARKA